MRTCGFYAKTYKILLFSDVLHFSLQNLFVTIQFLFGKSTFLDSFLAVFCLFFNICQVKSLLKSINLPYNKENFHVFQEFFLAKLCFFLFSLLKLIIYCESLQNLAKTQISCQVLKLLRVVFVVECVWTAADLYFLVILRAFLWKIQAGTFNFVGGTLICWENLNEFETLPMKIAIPVEVLGENVEICDGLCEINEINENNKDLNEKNYGFNDISGEFFAK